MFDWLIPLLIVMTLLIEIVGAFAASNCVAHETLRKHDCRFLH
jgi:hypothetical protein